MNTEQLRKQWEQEELFKDWNETLITSCLQGIMGEIYVNDTVNGENPESAAAVLGDFCFLTGKPERNLVERDYGKDFLIMVPQNEDWSKLIESVWGSRASRRMRYAIKKEPDCFDRGKLLGYVEKLPGEYRLCRIDEALYRQCLENGWSRDLVSQFPSYEDYRRLGLGIAVVYEGRIVSGASSYSRYDKGIEIEIDTEKAHRRRGLATAAGAALILDCLSRGLYPSWDAQNLWSVALAEKLGYTRDFDYPVYEISR
ncbi:MAG: GNAT family N-acetyltransferase [Lachnospiraceae bacterium]|nr:GNAT family N-acetyltransferase [Lachnospiraceae bacterium]